MPSHYVIMTDTLTRHLMQGETKEAKYEDADRGEGGNLSLHGWP